MPWRRQNIDALREHRGANRLWRRRLSNGGLRISWGYGKYLANFIRIRGRGGDVPAIGSWEFCTLFCRLRGGRLEPARSVSIVFCLLREVGFCAGKFVLLSFRSADCFSTSFWESDQAVVTGGGYLGP